MDANSDLRCASSLLATITPDVNVAKNRLMYMSIVAINDWNMRCVDSFSFLMGGLWLAGSIKVAEKLWIFPITNCSIFYTSNSIGEFFSSST
jgi:hypothetical protein